MLYADIILPLLPNRLFTYKVPEESEDLVQTGMRAIVQFGSRKYYTGIIKTIHHDASDLKEYKSIISLPDDKPVVNNHQLAFWDWMADYYMCSPGEVYKAALPAGLKISSNAYIIFNEDFPASPAGSSGREAVLNIVKKNSGIKLSDLSRLTGKKDIMRDVKDLCESGAVFLEERLTEKIRPKKEKDIFLSEPYHDPGILQQTLDDLQKAPKQRDILLKFLELAEGNPQGFRINRKELSLAVNTGTLRQLEKKGILSCADRVSLNIKTDRETLIPLANLNKAQKSALDEVRKIFKEKDVCLLHGVTSSGKTEIYMHLIAETIREGKQVLYLLPEIALTSQIIERLRYVFGDKAGIYHSRFSDTERMKVYNCLLKEDTDNLPVILGVRSSVFLPYSNLGLVIVDEEHENTFKQYDPSPRYHARDAAIMLAKMHKAKTLLGTATPSVETYTNCKTGKYGLVLLKNRFGEIKLPEIIIANTREARRKHLMKSVFTPLMMREIENSLNSGKQVILFQNRRGYSSFLECEICGWIPRCKTCDVSLTYHKFTKNLICHYCGYSQKVPGKCNDCSNTRIITRGFGTELIEDEMELFFPGVKTARLDLDTSRSIKSYEKILHDFAAGNTNILVGTQMLSKGLDFDGVGLVGILNADQMLNFPDFRAYERSFQLMMQVSGRAGRRDERGKVVIQTSNPGNPIIRYVRDNNFAGFFSDQYSERQIFNYPPFVKMIRITLKHKKPGELNNASLILSEKMRTAFGKRVLGPQDPVIGRIQSYYLKNILLKIEKKSSFDKARKLLRVIINELRTGQDSLLKIITDVDPF